MSSKKRSRGRPSSLPAVLPDEAEAFIKQLAALRRPNTCRSYRLALQHLYHWLERKNVTVESITRQHVADWCCYMHEQGLSAATRCLTLFGARAYFQYLGQMGRLQVDAMDLIRQADMPKLPKTLPRTLQPEADAKLSALFAGSKRPTWVALLLMRQTGIRVGELQAMPYECIKKDMLEKCYLKVPVGKLHSERLVPIGDTVVATVGKLQRLGLQGRKWLVPSRSNRQISYQTLRRAFTDATARLGIVDSQPLTIHRIRHTYATAMLNAGMNISVLKEILGHRDVNMTLRYATPTLELLSSEYDAAIESIHERYAVETIANDTTDEPTASVSVEEAIRLIERKTKETPQSTQREARRLLRRLARIRDELAQMRL